MVTGIPPSGRNMFKMTMPSPQEAQAKTVAPEENASPSVVSSESSTTSELPFIPNSSSSPNMMSRNFAQGRSEESRYIMARIDSFENAKQVQLQQQNDMFASLEQFGGISVSGTYYPNPLKASQAEAEEACQNESDEKVLEEAEEVLENMKEEIEEGVEEALDPKESKDSSKPVTDTTLDDASSENTDSESSEPENIPDSENKLPVTDIEDAGNNISPNVPGNSLPSTGEILESKDASFTEKAIVIEKVTAAEKEQLINSARTSDITADTNAVLAKSSSKAEQENNTSSALSSPIHFIV